MSSTDPADSTADSTGVSSSDDRDRPLPPGPDGYPVVGSTLSLLSDPFEFYDDLATYGDLVRYRAMGNQFTALLAADHVERVLVEEPDRFRRWEFGDVGLEFASEGLLSVDRDRWEGQRKLMRPAFTVERIRSYADGMADVADRMVAEWEDGAEIGLDEEFSDLTLQILSKTLFDLDLDRDDHTEAIARAANLITERSGPRQNVDMFLPDWITTPGQRRFDRAMAAYRDRVDALVDERREADPDAHDDLLSLLLSAEGPDGRSLSREEIRDNLVTFIFAGHETTALGLTYTFFLLSQHEQIADRLRRECDSVVGDDRVGFEHVPQLEYTEAVIDEAMRLYPPVPVIFRRVTEDAVFDGYRVLEGTIVTCPQFFIHTDDRYYEEPETFDPDRWIDGRKDDRPEYAYFPFGGGPRHCIGMRFARLEMQLVVATIARQFEMELLSDPDPDLSAAATLQPEAPIRVRIRRR